MSSRARPLLLSCLVALLIAPASTPPAALARESHGCPDGAPPEEQFDADKLEGLGHKRAKRTAKRHGCTLRVVRLDGVPLAVTDDYVMNRINVAIVDGRVDKVTGIG